MKLSTLQYIFNQEGDVAQEINVELVERDGLLFIQGELENSIENIIQEVREERIAILFERVQKNKRKVFYASNY